jgi:hypothetical protein
MDNRDGYEPGALRRELIARVVSELRGLNFDFEWEEDAAERIIGIVEESLMEARVGSCR